jgi:nucleotide-binding universal stress UspA family protein
MPAIQRIHIADDGSEHASWILHYALRMATQLDPPHVQVLHVREPGDGDIAARHARQLEVAARHGVSLEHRELAPAPDISRALVQAVRPGAEDVVLVGFRAHPHGRGLAFGTVGHALLARHDHNVLAMRVVEPGNMGLPKVAAVGISDSPGLGDRLAPALRLFAPALRELFLLRVIEVQQRLLGVLSYPRLEATQREGMAALARSVEPLREQLADVCPRTELRVSVAGHWPSQLVIDAHRARAHLLVLGASDHLLPTRFALSNPLEAVLENAACDVAVFRAGVT